MIIDLMENDLTNKIYDITYSNGMYKNTKPITRTFKGYVVNLIEDGTFNDAMKLKVVFGVANV